MKLKREIDTHGIKIDIKSLRNSAKQTVNWKTHGCRTAIYYDPKDGTVFTEDFTDEGSYLVFSDPTIMTVCNTTKKMTAQEIADEIARRTKE